MNARHEKPVYDHAPEPGETPIPELEDDETIAPRPEEEIADRLRAEPAADGHTLTSDSPGPTAPYDAR